MDRVNLNTFSNKRAKELVCANLSSFIIYILIKNR
jgi:hypothetical protein